VEVSIPVKLYRFMATRILRADIQSHKKKLFLGICCLRKPPLWSSGQSFWLQIQRSWVRFPALPDFLGSSGSGTGSTQPLRTT
jgi:hypothetical protein